jgi:hypothetical protein
MRSMQRTGAGSEGEGSQCLLAGTTHGLGTPTGRAPSSSG